MDEVQQVPAGAEQMAPRAEPGGDACEGIELEKEHGFEAGDGFFGVGAESYFEVWGIGWVEFLGRALDVERCRQELRRAAGGVEVGEYAVETGEGELGMETEIAHRFGSGMFMGEIAVILTDEEEVQKFFVDFFEGFDAFVGFRVGEVEPE